MRPPAGEYFAALSSRLNSTCSASTKSSDSGGRSGATAMATTRSFRIGCARRSAVETRSPTSTASRLGTIAPASSRVMSSRLPTKRSSRSASLSAVPSSSSRVGVVVAVAVAPEAGQRADDRGERRAQVVRHRGQHGGAQSLALGAQPRLVDVVGQGQRARSRRRPGCRRPRAAGAPRRRARGPPSRQHADHADAERLVRIGTNSQRPPGRVSVPRPVGWSASHDQRAAARSASLNSLSGGKAARGASLPSPGSALRHQDHDLGVQQPGEMGDHDPQQIVELDDAGDLAAEGVELGGGARLAPRRLGLRARARGERAGGDRHEHEEDQRHGIRRDRRS